MLALRQLSLPARPCGLGQGGTPPRQPADQESPALRWRAVARTAQRPAETAPHPADLHVVVERPRVEVAIVMRAPHAALTPSLGASDAEAVYPISPCGCSRSRVIPLANMLR